MNLADEKTRRSFLRVATGLGAGLVLNGCSGVGKPDEQKLAPSKNGDAEKGVEVTATEDLMREHGVLRRALLVYSEAAARLRVNPSSVAPNALHRTTKLFRAFGEEYHEKKLEEVYIFPAVKKAGGPAAVHPDILVARPGGPAVLTARLH